jgi:hypothetical protein
MVGDMTARRRRRMADRPFDVLVKLLSAMAVWLRRILG